MNNTQGIHEFQRAMVEALGFKLGEGVSEIHIHIVAGKIPTVEVTRELYDHDGDRLVRPFETMTLVPQAEWEGLLRKVSEL